MTRTHLGSFEGRLVSALALAALALGLLAATARPAAAQYFLFPTLPADLPLEHGNANKIVVGNGNILHAVYASGGKIYYSTSANGAAWIPPVVIASPLASHPAIAIDSAGKIGVAWVYNAGFGTGHGSLRYAWHSPGTPATTWNLTSLGLSGAEPALVAVGHKMHLAWGDLKKLKYATFPTNDALTPFAVEQVDSTLCASGSFRKPSLTVVPGPEVCTPPRVVVGYLGAGALPGCTNGIGPRVRRREGLGSWTQLFDNLVLGSSSAVAEPVSLSLSSNRSTGDLFLAWSDKLGGGARTVLVRGLNTVWTSPITLSPTARHVHVRAASSLAAPPTLFRLAWTAAGSGGDPFYGNATYVDTATWPGAAPVWTGVTLLSPLLAGRPQAIFWKRCLTSSPSPVLAELRSYFEAAHPTTGARLLATDYGTTATCPVGSIGYDTACPGVAVPIGTLGLAGQTTPGTVVELGELGVISRLTASSATVLTAQGGAVTVSWRSGSVFSTSDTSLTLTAPRADVTVSSADTAFSLRELGHLHEFDVRTVP
jgi:hypothetical protein